MKNLLAFGVVCLAVLSVWSLTSETVLAGTAEGVEQVISTNNPLLADHIPADLVRATDHSIVTAKNFDLDEMKLRLAQDPGNSDLRANLPSRLRDFMYLCETQTGEVSALHSGYRSYEKQAIIYSNLGSAGGAAVPGTSEHQSGLAADISVGGRFLTAASPTFTCFREQAWQYGWILSYPEGNRYLAGHSVYEPWHWRYVGLTAARLIHDYHREAWPQEFMSRLPYFHWLAENNITEDWMGVKKAQILLTLFLGSDDRRQLVRLPRLRFFAGQLAERVGVSLWPLLAKAEDLHTVAPVKVDSPKPRSEQKVSRSPRRKPIKRIVPIDFQAV